MNENGVEDTLGIEGVDPNTGEVSGSLGGFWSVQRPMG